MTQELIRRIDNIVQLGKVCEIKSDEGKALARVNIHGRVTDFLPIFLWNSDFVKVWMPIRLNQQVSVLCPYGDANFGVILPGIYHKNNKEPKGANEKNVIVEIGSVRFECDGQSVAVNAKNFKLDFQGNLVITGRITDTLGDLTGHEHSVKNHSVAVKRG